MAERQALVALSDKAKDSVVSLITIPDLEFDFDGTPKKTVGEKWKTRKEWIDADSKIQTEVMPDERLVFIFVFDEIRKFKSDAIPIASLDCSPKVVAQIAAIVATDKKGVGIRVCNAATPRCSKAEMEALVKLPDVQSWELPMGKLAIHEELPLSPTRSDPFSAKRRPHKCQRFFLPNGPRRRILYSQIESRECRRENP